MKRIMRSSILALLVTASGVLVPSVATAVDLGIDPRLNTGAMYYKYEESGTVFNDPVFPGEQTTENGFELSTWMPFVGGGATLFVDRFFIDIYAQHAFSSEAQDPAALVTQTSSLDSNFAPLSTVSTLNFTSDIKRTEASIAAGLSVTENIAMFGGYRWSETDFEEKVTDDSFFSGEVAERKRDFRQTGFFFGGALGTAIEGEGLLNGYLSLNLALAFLDGRITRNNQPLFTFRGSTTGLNVGVSWKGLIPAVKGLGYSIGVDGYSYDFEADSFDEPDVTETNIRTSVGLSYSF